LGRTSVESGLNNMTAHSQQLAARRFVWLLGTMLTIAAASAGGTAGAKTRHPTPAAAQGAAVEAQLAAAPAANQRTVSLTLKQLGAWSMRLRGVDGMRSMFFTIRSDEVVVGAKLRLAYDYSPALIPELSHLSIAMNDRVVAVEPLPRGSSVGNVREISLDPRAFRDSNELRFNFIGHYTQQCEDPWHSSLWLTISELSRLELTLASASAAGDLSSLPAPFLDRRDSEALNLPFVFSSAPSLGTIRAAGTVASWFGLQAGGRPVQFPVSFGQLPPGNAVVFLSGTESVGPLRAGAGAALSIHPHPANPAAKLLVLTGPGEEQLALVARAIALGHMGLAGTSVNITKAVAAPARKPGDAPAWVRTDRPMKLGEIARPEELRVQGYFPEIIRVNYRVPPDVFTWRSEGVPLRLRYRATTLPAQRNSTLGVGVNNVFVQSLALNEPNPTHPQEIGSLRPNPSVRTASMFIPPYTVGGRGQLQVTFAFEMLREGACRNVPPDNMVGMVDAESTIDFSGFPRYVALPNLSYFASIGYPYTRLADLSETAIVLPDRPGADEVALYLAVMGRMGEATGYPAIRHALVTAAEVEKQPDRDLIVVGSGNNQPLMGRWAAQLPMVGDNGERRVRDAAYSWRPTYRWEQRDIDDAPESLEPGMTLAGTGRLAALMAFESPLKAARSVVVLYADRSSDLRKLADALLDTERVGLIQGDLAVVDDRTVSHTKVGQTYHLGSLPVVRKLHWFLSEQPLLLALLALLASVALATVLYRALRRARLHRARG
jgi:cellulose synthase operon protein B